MLHSICQQIWKVQQWPQDWKRSVFTPIAKKGNAKECSNYCTIALIWHASKVMLKILQATLQQYVNRELPYVQAGFRKGKGTRDQIANIRWIVEKAREFQKSIYFCFIEYAKDIQKVNRFIKRCTSLIIQFSSVAQSCPTQRPHESQHARPPYPSPTPGVYSNSCPSSLWCHPAIWSSVVPFSSCPQSLPASGSFLMSRLFAGGGQSIGVLASASVLPMNTQDWSPLGWTCWISLLSKGLSRVFSNTTVQKHQFFSAQLSSQSNSHIHTWPL